MFDSGFNPKRVDWRVLLFSDITCLNSVANAEMILSDGTHTSAPKPFQQIVTFHISYPDIGSVPLVYALLPNKDRETYEYVLRVLRALIRKHTNCPNWNGPKKYVTDFELAMLLAVKTIYEETEIGGCLFHLGQALYRHIVSIGLRELYEKDSVWSLRARVLVALAFLPVAEVRQAFAKLWDTGYFYETKQGDNLDPATKAKITQVYFTF